MSNPFVTKKHFKTPYRYPKQFYMKGSLVDMIEGYEAQATIAKRESNGWSFESDEISQLLESLRFSDNNDMFFSFKNALYVEAISDDWSIVLFKNKFLAVRTKNLSLKQY